MSHFLKKTIELDVDIIKRLRKIFDVKTDKEAVNLALKMVADEDDIIQTHTELAGHLALDATFI